MFGMSAPVERKKVAVAILLYLKFPQRRNSREELLAQLNLKSLGQRE